MKFLSLSTQSCAPARMKSLNQLLQCMGALLAGNLALEAAEFTVTTTDDTVAADGDLSLREAIELANSSPEADVISFDLGGGGPFAILLDSPLPAITAPLTIDGFTQPGSEPLPAPVIMVELVGVNLPYDIYSGLVVESGDCTIKGLAIHGFRNGILLNNPSNPPYQNIRFEANYIGLDASGILGIGNTHIGIYINGTEAPKIIGNRFGDNATAGIYVFGSNGAELLDNVAFRNYYGLVLTASDNAVLRGNIAGTDSAGTAFIGNSIGFEVEGCNSFIITENLISGNWGAGLNIMGSQGVVSGNKIGTDASGSTQLGNGWVGIEMRNCGEVTITENLLSGNQRGIDGYGITESLISRNHIGADLAGTAALPNRWEGIFLVESWMTTIEENLISGNAERGISIQWSTECRVARNQIGVDLSGTTSLGNGYEGVQLFDSWGITVEENILSGNFRGVVVELGGGSLIKGNLIGTNKSGTAAIPNLFQGVWINEAFQTAVVGNLISGNTFQGIFTYLSSSTGIFENTLGYALNGVDPIPNGTFGVVLNSQFEGAVSGNNISNNLLGGIRVINSAGIWIDQNRVQGNGEDILGYYTAGIGLLLSFDCMVLDNLVTDNNTSGMLLAGSAFNSLFGNFVERNTTGVDIAQVFTQLPDDQFEQGLAIGNRVLYNSISDNSELGIDLARRVDLWDGGGNYLGEERMDYGPTLNDEFDLDEGANGYLNTPILQNAKLKNGTLTVKGTLKGLVGSTQLVQVFASSSEDPSGFGEGERFIGEGVVTTNDEGNGHFAFDFEEAEVQEGEFITTTATDQEDNTSEFSMGVAVK